MFCTQRPLVMKYDAGSEGKFVQEVALLAEKPFPVIYFQHNPPVSPGLCLELSISRGTSETDSSALSNLFGVWGVFFGR